MQLTLFQWHTLWPKHETIHNRVELILREHSCFYAPAFSQDMSITILYYHGLNLTCESIEKKC